MIVTAFAASAASAFELPSGQDISFQDSFYERQGDGTLRARFRFVMPAISDGVTYADVAEDFVVLCERYALPALAGGEAAAQVVISLADRPTEFGVRTPEATQYFEAFRPEGSACMWEDF